MIKGIIFDMWGVLIENDRTLMAGAVEVLESLNGKYKLGIATSIGRERMNEILEDLGVAKYFEARSCGSDVKYNKPHFEVYERTRELMRIEADECVVVEDTTEYHESIKSTGMSVVKDFAELKILLKNL